MTGNSGDNSLMDLAEALRRRVGGEVLVREPLARHTTIGLGGPADLFVRAMSVEELRQVFLFAGEHNLPVTPLGSGSNVLVSDSGVRGIVVQADGDLQGLRVEGERCVAGGGCPISRAISDTARAGLAGLEVLYGVPGTVGGAVIMNAGTRNGCVADTLEGVTLVGRDGSVRDASAAELGLSYRHSALQEQQGDVFVAQAVFRLRPEDPAAIRERIARYADARRASQPLDWRSCGCMFRNPESDSAGRLIDATGLKGLSEGGAQVSDRHANFIVVSPGATASDVRRLAEKVRRLVQERHGVTLEYEVKLLGEWPDE